MRQRNVKNQILEVRNFALYEYATAFCRIQMARNVSMLSSIGHARHVKNSTHSLNNMIMTAFARP